jgi:hypothetical protein
MVQYRIYVTKSMGPNPLEDKRLRKFSIYFGTLLVYYRVYNRPLLASILCQMSEISTSYSMSERSVLTLSLYLL